MLNVEIQAKEAAAQGRPAGRDATAVPSLDLDVMRTLVAIADAGSFSGAAAAVHRTPSAVSMQVRKAEDAVGRALFLRDSRSVAATPDGEVLIAHARQLLALHRKTMARFASPDLVGTVTVGAPDDVAEHILPTMLRRFSEAYPGVAVTVSIEPSVEMAAKVAEGRMDLALLHCDCALEAGAAAEVIYRERLVWATLKGGTAVTREPLPLSVWDEGCSWRRMAVDALDGAGRPWRLAYGSAHSGAQKAAVLADLAVAPLAASSLGRDIVEAPADAGLPEIGSYALGLVVRPDASAPVRAAADHMRAAFVGRTGLGVA